MLNSIKYDIYEDVFTNVWYKMGNLGYLKHNYVLRTNLYEEVHRIITINLYFEISNKLTLTNIKL